MDQKLRNMVGKSVWFKQICTGIRLILPEGWDFKVEVTSPLTGRIVCMTEDLRVDFCLHMSITSHPFVFRVGYSSCSVDGRSVQIFNQKGLVAHAHPVRAFRELRLLVDQDPIQLFVDC